MHSKEAQGKKTDLASPSPASFMLWFIMSFSKHYEQAADEELQRWLFQDVSKTEIHDPFAHDLSERFTWDSCEVRKGQYSRYVWSSTVEVRRHCYIWSGILSAIPVAKGKAVGAPLSFYREELICRVSKDILAVSFLLMPLLRRFSFLCGPFSFCLHNANHLPVVSNKDFWTKNGF